MQRAEYQVAGFRRRHGQANGFQVTHFPHQNAVRVFAQSRTQSGGKGLGHRPHFALVHQAFFRLVDKFNGVFHRQDVALLVAVEVIHHGRQGGRFARASRAGDQHHTARLEGQIGKNLGGVQVFQGQNFAGNGSKYCPRAPVLVEGVHPETGQSGDLEGEVHLQVFLVGLALTVIHDVVHHAVHHFVVQWLDIDAPHIAMHADHGGQASG